MDELIRQGQWWWLLVPLATGLFALAGSWLGAHLGRQNEHGQWLRNEKVDAYTSYLSVTQEFLDYCQALKAKYELEKDETMISRRARAHSRLELLASDRVRPTSVDHFKSVSAVLGAVARWEVNGDDGADFEEKFKVAQDLETELVNGMRHELRIPTYKISTP